MTTLWQWFDTTILDIRRQFRWSFVPPLMVYFAAGVAGFTAIVSTFFIKEYLELSAAFLAGLSFWAGLPWALKMPLGHLVDLIWRWKGILVYAGAGLVAASLLIMYFLISAPEDMANVMSIPAWYVTSVILSAIGYVVQDAVADAMSVEAVPRHDGTGQPLDEETIKALHTTMQTFGRIALIFGLVVVATINILMLADVEQLSQVQKTLVYARIYLIALFIPVISVSGVVAAAVMRRTRMRQLEAAGMARDDIATLVDQPSEPTQPNPWYFIGGLGFVALSLAIGLGEVPFGQEIVFLGSMTIVLFLMRELAKTLEADKALSLFGTAIIIFVFRAVPLPGAGQTWFEIDILGFNQQFLSVLYLISSCLTLAGMIVLRPLMARRPITYIVVLLTLAAGILSLPNIALYYGIHYWTAPATGGVVDARFIAVIDTAIESPLGQIAMIPMLAWIARNAPDKLKATFFAVMASFTNLALSASSLLTKYLNEVFVVTREVKRRDTGTVEVPADYSELGILLIVVAVVGLVGPLVTIHFVQRSPLRTAE